MIQVTDVIIGIQSVVIKQVWPEIRKNVSIAIFGSDGDNIKQRANYSYRQIFQLYERCKNDDMHERRLWIKDRNIEKITSLKATIIKNKVEG